MRLVRSMLAAAIAAPFILSACSKDAAAPASMLGYVPADTPFVMANLEPIPKDVTDAWSKRFEPLAKSYDKLLDQVLREMNEKSDKDELPQRVGRAILEELKGNLSIAGMEKFGFTPQSYWAFYGIGLVPVMRVELRDPAAFQALVGRIEQRAGEKLPGGTIGNQAYWRLGPAEGQVAGLMALVGKDLVVSLMPKNASEDLVGRLLGTTLPERSMADGAPVSKLNADYGFKPYGSGFIDVVRVATAIIDEKSGIEKEFLQAFGGEDLQVSPECRGEFLEIAGNWPRITIGYDVIDAKVMDYRMVLELKPELAQEFVSLAAPVPGSAGADKALASFGMSLRLDKLPGVVGKHASAVAAAPYKCPQLAHLNDGFAELQQNLSNPMVFAAAPVVGGFYAELSKFEMASLVDKPDVAGKLVLASDNPSALVAMAKNFVPQFASLDLQPGSGVVALPAGLVPPDMPPVHVAMADKAIAFSFGADEAAGLVTLLGAPAATPAPLMSFAYSGSIMAKFMDMAGKTSTATMSDEEKAEYEASMEVVRAVYGSMFESLSMALVPTERGLELRQVMRLQ